MFRYFIFVLKKNCQPFSLNVDHIWTYKVHIKNIAFTKENSSFHSQLNGMLWLCKSIKSTKLNGTTRYENKMSIKIFHMITLANSNLCWKTFLCRPYFSIHTLAACRFYLFSSLKYVRCMQNRSITPSITNTFMENPLDISYEMHCIAWTIAIVFWFSFSFSHSYIQNTYTNSLSLTTAFNTDLFAFSKTGKLITITYVTFAAYNRKTWNVLISIIFSVRAFIYDFPYLLSI